MNILSKQFLYTTQSPQERLGFFLTVNSGADSSFMLPTMGYLNNKYNSYNWIINWGDGSETTETGIGAIGAGINHIFPQANTEYEIEIKPVNTNQLGWLGAFGFGNNINTGAGVQTNKDKAIKIDGQLNEQMVRTNVNSSYVCAYWFYGCTNITMGDNFNLPQEITRVDTGFCASMFAYCSGNNFTMNSILQLPQNITISGDLSFCSAMFQNCSGANFTMNSILQLPQALTVVGNSFCASMFQNCSGANFTMNSILQLPPNIITTGNSFCASMFMNCSGANFTMNDVIQIPPNITTISSSFFYRTFIGCSGISFAMNDVIQIPQKLVNIASNFCYSAFTSCSGNPSQTAIKPKQFFGNLTLTQTQLNLTNTFFVAFSNCNKFTEEISPSTIPLLNVSPAGTNQCFRGCKATSIVNCPANWK